MSANLFNDFTPVTPTTWKQKIQVDLKGADYNETLLWKTEEGIDVKPFYTKEDRTDLKTETPTNYNICQSVFIDDENIANSILKEALENGVTAIECIATKQFDITLLLEDIETTACIFYFNLKFLDVKFNAYISEHFKEVTPYFNVDIFGNLAKNGNWFNTLSQDKERFKTFSDNTQNSIAINVDLYQNAGATITQQLAYALAQANEYIHYLGEESISKIYFIFSVGSNYFFEIAKLKAFKILWKTLTESYNKNVDSHLFVKPSLRNKTIYDYNTNLLRTTSECMSAILGAANTICNLSYDHLYHKQNKFGERIARNQLLVLKHESYFNGAQEFAEGTYYIEQLTEQLAENALTIFKSIEKGGGFLSQLKEGTIQKKISESATKEQEKFNANEIILLGTNIVPNPMDKMKYDLELHPFVKNNPIKTLISPIIAKRLAEEMEQNRLKTE